MKQVRLLFIALLLIITSNIYGQAKWNINEQNNVTIYTPNDLKSGKIFDVYAFGPTKALDKDLKTWVLETAQAQQELLGVPLKKWVVKPEKEDYSVTNNYKDDKGTTMQVAYQGGKLDDGRLFFIRLITSSDLVTVLKYGVRLDDLLVDIKENLLSKKTVSNTQNVTMVQEPTPTVITTATSDQKEIPIVPATGPKNLKNLRGIIVYGMQPSGFFGTTSKVIATFDDGTYTWDIKRVFSEGLSASKKAKPNRWGQWRIRNNELELKDHNDHEFKTTQGDWIATPAQKDLKLNGCYGNITSSSYDGYGGGSTVGNASSWCFKPNGRFAHSKTGFANASGDVSGSSSSSKKTGGKYYISDYVAKFVYDDGTELVTAFCFLNEKKSHIAINGKRYMGK